MEIIPQTIQWQNLKTHQTDKNNKKGLDPCDSGGEKTKPS